MGNARRDAPPRGSRSSRSPGWRCPVCHAPLSGGTESAEFCSSCARHGDWIPFGPARAGGVSPSLQELGDLADILGDDADAVARLAGLVSSILRRLASPRRLRLRPPREWACVICGDALTSCYCAAFSAWICESHGLWIERDQVLSFVRRATKTLGAVVESMPPELDASPRRRRQALIAEAVERLT